MTVVNFSWETNLVGRWWGLEGDADVCVLRVSCLERPQGGWGNNPVSLFVLNKTPGQQQYLGSITVLSWHLKKIPCMAYKLHPVRPVSTMVCGDCSGGVLYWFSVWKSIKTICSDVSLYFEDKDVLCYWLTILRSFHPSKCDGSLSAALAESQ